MMQREYIEFKDESMMLRDKIQMLEPDFRNMQ